LAASEAVPITPSRSSAMAQCDTMAGAYVHSEGVRRKTIPASAVQKLIEELRSEGFFQWEEKKTVCLDLPEVRITATLKG
jgi:hypothetical protein